MKSLHKMLIHVINTLEMCDHKNDRQQCYDLITDLIKQLHAYDNCIEEGKCVASVPEHFLLHSISTALQTGTLQKMFNTEKNEQNKHHQYIQRRQKRVSKNTSYESTPSFIDKYEHGVNLFFGNSLSS